MNIDDILKSFCTLPTDLGDFSMYDSGDPGVRIICMGRLEAQGPRPLLRIHSSCIASEVFGATDCDCADQLREAMKQMAIEARGIVIHLEQEGRGHGLSKKIRAIQRMQEDDLDTVQAFERLKLEQDIRSYASAAQLLHQLGIRAVELITNNPRKVRYLEAHNIKVSLRPTHPQIRPENRDYLQTKKTKLEHLLNLSEEPGLDSDILFYHSDQAWGALSNFSPHAIFVRGRVWPTVEHFYQAQKFHDPARAEEIRRSKTPTRAKQRARSLARDQRPDWPKKKEAVMIEGLRAKFHQHPDLAELLESSDAREIIEHTATDPYWGDGGDGSGQNRLGALLMTVRAELRAAAEDS